MKINNLAKFALIIVLIGMIVGIGVLILDKLGSSSATWVTEGVNNESIVWPIATGTVSLANTNIVTFTKIGNITTGVYGSGNYTIDSDTGVVTATSNTTGIATGTTVYAYYTYSDRDRPATTALQAARDALAEIATSWMSLIVLIASLSIILGMVIRSFTGTGTR